MKLYLITMLTALGFFGMTISGTVDVVRQLPTSSDTLPSPETERIQHGIEVYRSQYCGMCHTLTIANTRGTFGPSHDAMGRVAVERILEDAYSGKAATVEDYIKESIINPVIYKVPEYILSSHQMPSYEHLPTEDIGALVYLLIQQVDASD